MKNNDLLLYGGIAAAAYFLFIKPKHAAHPATGVTVIPPVTHTGLAANQVQSSMQTAGIANQVVSLIPSLVKLFGPSSSPIKPPQLIAPVDNLPSYIPESAATLISYDPPTITPPVYSDLGQYNDPNSEYNASDMYGFDYNMDGGEIDTSTIAGVKTTYFKTCR